MADDHVLFREALLVYMQSKCPDWDVQVCSNVDETLGILKTEHESIDLILLDLRMPGMNGMDGLKQIKKQFPDNRVSILTGVAEENHVHQAIEHGAWAYLPKTLSAKALIKAIELIVNTGHRFIPMDDSGHHPMPSYYDDFQAVNKDHPPTDGEEDQRKTVLQSLTPREKQVLHYLGQGLSNNDIATELNLKPSTVKIHVGKLCKKLQAENRTQAALMCQRYNLDAIP